MPIIEIKLFEEIWSFMSVITFGQLYKRMEIFFHCLCSKYKRHRQDYWTELFHITLIYIHEGILLRFFFLFFSVDTSQAGQGDINIEVVCNGQQVPAQRMMLDMNNQRYTFVPRVAMNHTLDATFNYEKVPGKQQNTIALYKVAAREICLLRNFVCLWFCFIIQQLQCSIMIIQVKVMPQEFTFINLWNDRN